MDDDLHHRITELVDEEHRLDRGHSGRELTADERARRGGIEDVPAIVGFGAAAVDKKAVGMLRVAGLFAGPAERCVPPR